MNLQLAKISARGRSSRGIIIYRNFISLGDPVLERIDRLIQANLARAYKFL